MLNEGIKGKGTGPRKVNAFCMCVIWLEVPVDHLLTSIDQALGDRTLGHEGGGEDRDIKLGVIPIQ